MLDRINLPIAQSVHNAKLIEARFACKRIGTPVLMDRENAQYLLQRLEVVLDESMAMEIMKITNDAILIVRNHPHKEGFYVEPCDVWIKPARLEIARHD